MALFSLSSMERCSQHGSVLHQRDTCPQLLLPPEGTSLMVAAKRLRHSRLREKTVDFRYLQVAKEVLERGACLIHLPKKFLKVHPMTAGFPQT